MNTIYISCGDVNGIGLRCLDQALLENPHLSSSIQLVIDERVYQEACDVYSLSAKISVYNINSPARLSPGSVTADASLLAMESLSAACSLAATTQGAGLVTLPINKHALRQAGWRFPGQTEMVAAVSGGEPLMVLCSGKTRVGLATIHVPLRDVPMLITSDLLVTKLQILHDHLQSDVGISHPRIAVLGLNPHASEHGEIGSEDLDVTGPAILKAQAHGFHVEGPFAADGFFGFGNYSNFDGILAMYHDQGLIPLKLLSKGAGVNVTAGLSIVRTSPDHGTAYDKAATGDVDARSTAESILLCSALVANRQKL